MDIGEPKTKFYRVFTEFQEYYKSKVEQIHHGYFLSWINAYCWCEEISKECGNNVPDMEDFHYELKNYGRADIGAFIVEECEFMDKETP